MRKPSKKEIFKSFIDKYEVLVVDKNTSSRSRLLKIMSDLGSKRHMIHTAGSLQEATEIINTKNIGVILSDYFIAGGSGFDLFKMTREKFPGKKICLILVTSDLTQSTVAKAAEEDVDSFIIKPYTVESIQENLISTIADKIQPSQYIQTIEESKALIEKAMYTEALTKLQFALTLHSKPALALFYIGQAEYLRELADKAQGSYNKGLAYNNIHFKCLIGLFDILMERKEFDEAYQVVKKIAKYFPANPDRLQQIVRLAIQTNNFQDMPFYYEIFTALDERTSPMVNYIGAGLFVSGKHYLQARATKDALKLFEYVGVSCSEFTKFPRAIISLLIENGLADEAEKFLKRFDASARDGQDYLVSDYLVDAAKFKDNNKIIKNGLDLYNKNVKDPQCMQLMITAMKESGYTDEKIAPFLKEMNDRWPDRMAS